MLIVGLGPVGLAALQLARAMGADKLIGVEYDAERLKIAQDLHLADYVFQSNEETLGKILSVTGGKGAEKLWTAPQTIRQAARNSRNEKLWKNCICWRGKHLHLPALP